MPHLTNPLHHHEKPAQPLGAQQQGLPGQHVGPETASLHQQGTLVDGAHPGQHNKHHHDKHHDGTTPSSAGFFHGYTAKGWFRQHWVDLVTMAVIGAIALAIYTRPPAPTRSFAIDFQDGEIIYPQFAYPLRKEIIPIWAAALLAFFVPAVVFAIVQIQVRSFHDFNTAIFGLLYSLICAATFQVFIKWLIGGLRPHFLTVCAPAIPAGTVGTGFQSIYFDRSICTGDDKQINDSLESMPSGHSTAAWAGFFFLSLYLNGHLKIFADTRSQFWKMIAFFAPILGAFLIAASLSIDEYHNWYDLVAGSTIGTLNAIAAYRMSYASLWDFRFNHCPLPRDTTVTGRFPYTLESAVTDRHFASAWRHSGGVVQGAPGDAAHGGVGAGVGQGLTQRHQHGSSAV